MLGSLVLNWYPKRNPSEDISRTTGLSSFLSGWEEKKTKKKTAERVTQVMIRRDVKMKQLEMEIVEESALMLSRGAFDWLGGSSSGSKALCLLADDESPEIIASLSGVAYSLQTMTYLTHKIEDTVSYTQDLG